MNDERNQFNLCSLKNNPDLANKSLHTHKQHQSPHKMRKPLACCLSMIHADLIPQLWWQKLPHLSIKVPSHVSEGVRMSSVPI